MYLLTRSRYAQPVERINYKPGKENSTNEDDIESVIIHGKTFSMDRPVHFTYKTCGCFDNDKIDVESERVKRLIKKDSSRLYGVGLANKKQYYCEVANYYPDFEFVTLEKRDYDKGVNVEAVMKSNADNRTKAMCAVANRRRYEYDLGFVNLNDYYDLRYDYAGLKKIAAPDKSELRVKCGLDGCSFACYSQDEMKEHKERHQFKEGIPCKEEGCKHYAKSLEELKYHMISHSHTLFLCPRRSCNTLLCGEGTIARHLQKHLQANIIRQYRNNFRGYCPLCRQLVRVPSTHQLQHPEFLFSCPFPSCRLVFNFEQNCADHIREFHIDKTKMKRIL